MPARTKSSLAPRVPSIEALDRGSGKTKGPGSRRGLEKTNREGQYMPPIPPPPPGIAGAFSFSLISETRASVVSIRPATEAAF